ncbi:MAG: DUF3048 domain-containing protein, partial [Anaerolinea sp.]|nr:DUF3048 domain-containing protein [Anaerolinea sp.]
GALRALTGDLRTLPAVTPAIAIATGSPLTGRPVPADALTRRPLIVKISNAPAAVRPQTALSLADHVYEHYTEGGLTRFSAIYLTHAPPRVGSIRSARLIDLELMSIYDGLLVYAGASDGVLARLMGADFFNRTYNEATAVENPIFSRDPAIRPPHNLFADASAAWAEAEADGHRAGVRDLGLHFAVEPPPSARPGRFVSLRYRGTQVDWIYDETQNVYRRLVDGLLHLDAFTAAPIAATNVVVLFATHSETDIVESVGSDGTIFYSLAIDLLGTGEALLLRDGGAYPLTWRRDDPTGVLHFSDGQGDPAAFQPGTIWFQVFPPPADWLPNVEQVDSG